MQTQSSSLRFKLKSHGLESMLKLKLNAQPQGSRWRLKVQAQGVSPRLKLKAQAHRSNLRLKLKANVQGSRWRLKAQPQGLSSRLKARGSSPRFSAQHKAQDQDSRFRFSPRLKLKAQGSSLKKFSVCKIETESTFTCLYLLCLVQNFRFVATVDKTLCLIKNVATKNLISQKLLRSHFRTSA